jgi:hypothetical protein
MQRWGIDVGRWSRNIDVRRRNVDVRINLHRACATRKREGDSGTRGREQFHGMTGHDDFLGGWIKFVFTP